MRSPIGEGLILTSDEAQLRRAAGAGLTSAARLLPSGDSFYLLQGAERELLVPDPVQRAELWTSRVWPGAVLLGGEIRGTWRRAKEIVSVTMWTTPSTAQREAIEAEAVAMPIPGLGDLPIRLRWE